MTTILRRLALIFGISLYVATAANASLVVPQSTSFTLAVGPFVSSTDGSTLQTGLTVNASDVLLSKNGGTYAAKNSGACPAASTTGMYLCTFNATDGNTAGSLQVNVNLAGSLPVYHELQVIPSATYAITYGTGATGLAPANVTQVGGSAVTSSGGVLAVNTTQVNGSAPAAATLATSFNGTVGPALPLGILRQGTAASVAAGTITLDGSSPFASNTLNGTTVVACGSTQGYCQSASIASNTGATATLAANWPVTPSGTITYYIFGTASPSGGGGGATPADIWAYSGGRTVTGVSGNVTGSVASVTGAVGSVTGNVGGNVVGSVASVTGNVGGTVNGLTSTGQANVRAALGMASANMDTQLSGVPTAVWGNSTRLLTAGTNIVLAKGTGVTGFNDPTAASNAAAVWDLSISGHTTPGTTGALLNAAGTGGLDPTALRAALGLASPNLDTQLVGINTNVLALNGGMVWNPAWDAEVQSEVDDALQALTITEPTGKPAWGGNPWQWLAWIGAWTRNEIQQTSSQKILRNDAGNANIATCSVTDNGSTLTVAECAP